MFMEIPRTSERLPSQAEVRSLFEAILNGKPYKELRVVNDEQGLSLCEVESTLESGERIELNFQTAKNDYKAEGIPAGGRFSASIHVIVYDENNMPCGGSCMANYLDGRWVSTD
jgi:hypothetical protein